MVGEERVDGVACLGRSLEFFTAVLGAMWRFFAQVITDNPRGDDNVTFAGSGAYSAPNSHEHDGVGIVVLLKMLPCLCRVALSLHAGLGGDHFDATRINSFVKI